MNMYLGLEQLTAFHLQLLFLSSLVRFRLLQLSAYLCWSPGSVKSIKCQVKQSLLQIYCLTLKDVIKEMPEGFITRLLHAKICYLPPGASCLSLTTPPGPSLPSSQGRTPWVKFHHLQLVVKFETSSVDSIWGDQTFNSIWGGKIPQNFNKFQSSFNWVEFYSIWVEATSETEPTILLSSLSSSVFSYQAWEIKLESKCEIYVDET